MRRDETHHRSGWAQRCAAGAFFGVRSHRSSPAPSLRTQSPCACCFLARSPRSDRRVYGARDPDQGSASSGRPRHVTSQLRSAGAGPRNGRRAINVILPRCRICSATHALAGGANGHGHAAYVYGVPYEMSMSSSMNLCGLRQATIDARSVYAPEGILALALVSVVVIVLAAARGVRSSIVTVSCSTSDSPPPSDIRLSDASSASPCFPTGNLAHALRSEYYRANESS